VYGNADEKLRIVSTDPNSAIFHTNAAGSNDTAWIGFAGLTGYLNIRDPSNNVMMSFSSIGGGINMPTTAFITQANISSLNVSSINSSKPIVNWSTIGFSAANFPGGAGTVPISNVPFAVTDSFVVDTARKYRVSLEAEYSNVDATGSYTTLYMSGTTPTVYLTTINNSNGIPANNNARGGSSAIFRPTLSTVQLITLNSSGIAATGIQVNTAAGVVVEDLGPA
jgi:hypothetical protein